MNGVFKVMVNVQDSMATLISETNRIICNNVKRGGVQGH